ncbi:MAG: pentapeptide repeat-containing protein [Cyanobacteria bacterium]|nr:pentapeptide repeat-containing protein [Cyanobacteriota bacterium]
MVMVSPPAKARIWAIAIALLTLLLGWCGAIAPAAAQLKEYAPPTSYSNAELSRRDFSKQTLRGAEFTNANLSYAKFIDAQAQAAAFSGSLLKETDLSGADLTYALMDSVKFIGTNFTNTVLTEALLLGSEFRDVQITGADFDGALLDGYQQKQLCAIASGTNPTTGIATRDSLGCP